MPEHQPAVGGEIISAYVKRVMVPSLRPAMVVVIYDLGAHKADGVRQAVEAAQCRLMRLPLYSPDLSPIENILS